MNDTHETKTVQELLYLLLLYCKWNNDRYIIILCYLLLLYCIVLLLCVICSMLLLLINCNKCSYYCQNLYIFAIAWWNPSTWQHPKKSHHNPCFSGILFAIVGDEIILTIQIVTILVLVEDSLQYNYAEKIYDADAVTILVLVEYSLQ